MERGLAKKDLQRMTIGEIVDFTTAYNDRQKQGKEAEERRSKATKYRDVFLEDGSFIDELEQTIEYQPIQQLLGSCPFNELICLLLDCNPETRLSIDDDNNVNDDENNTIFKFVINKRNNVVIPDTLNNENNG